MIREIQISWSHVRFKLKSLQYITLNSLNSRILIIVIFFQFFFSPFPLFHDSDWRFNKMSEIKFIATDNIWCLLSTLYQQNIYNHWKYWIVTSFRDNFSLFHYKNYTNKYYEVLIKWLELTIHRIKLWRFHIPYMTFRQLESIHSMKKNSELNSTLPSIHALSLESWSGI